MRWEYHGVKSHGILLYTMVYNAILVFIWWNMFCVKLQYVHYNNLYYFLVMLMLYHIYVIEIYDGMYVRNIVNILN